MIQTRKLMVFDFDGVVCDSTNECLVTSWNAWEEWESRSTFRENLDDFKKLHAAFKNLDPAQMITNGLSAPLHNGAVRYYKEQGWM